MICGSVSEKKRSACFSCQKLKVIHFCIVILILFKLIIILGKPFEYGGSDHLLGILSKVFCSQKIISHVVLDTFMSRLHEFTGHRIQVVVFQQNYSSRLLSELTDASSDDSFGIFDLAAHLSVFRDDGAKALRHGCFYWWWGCKRVDSLPASFDAFMARVASAYLAKIQATTVNCNAPIIVVCGMLFNGSDDIDGMLFKLELNRHLKDLVTHCPRFVWFDHTDGLLEDMHSEDGIRHDVFCAQHPLSFAGPALLNWRVALSSFVERTVSTLDLDSYPSFVQELDLLKMIKHTFPSICIESSLRCYQCR